MATFLSFNPIFVNFVSLSTESFARFANVPSTAASLFGYTSISLVLNMAYFWGNGWAISELSKRSSNLLKTSSGGESNNV